MSVCAGSLIKVFRSFSGRRFSSSPLVQPRKWSGPQEKHFQVLRRPGPDGSRARQDWVHEYAETGTPPNPSDGELSREVPVYFQLRSQFRQRSIPERFATRWSPGTQRKHSDSDGEIRISTRQRNGGPASRSGSSPQRKVDDVGNSGRDLSAIG